MVTNGTVIVCKSVWQRFGPSPASVPVIDVKLVALNAYDELATVHVVPSSLEVAA